MKLWTLVLALAFAALGSGARAEARCDGFASGAAGQVTVSLVYDDTGRVANVFRGWKASSAGGITITAIRWDKPLDPMSPSSSPAASIRIRASGDTVISGSNVVFEVSVDGGPPMTGGGWGVNLVSPESAKVPYEFTLRLDPSTLIDAKRVEVTLRDSAGPVIEHWSFQYDVAALQTLEDAAMAGARRQAEAPQGCPSPALAAKPDWVRIPSGDDAARYYPEKAQKDRLGGRVILECGVTLTGTLGDCIVLSETPADLEFGDAALRMAKYFRMREIAPDGLPVAGSKVQVPIVFMPPSR